MTQYELTKLNIGQDLDDLMNLDPRGYGVCRILYQAARAYTGKPLSIHFAEKLLDCVREGDFVYILTGFVLLPFKKAEMDGIIGAVLLARALTQIGAKPVLVMPEETKYAAEKLATAAGIHFYDSIEEAANLPLAMAAVTFTKEKSQAVRQSEDLLAKALPTAVIAIESPGANEYGIYHNATGLNVTDIEAKSDVLFEILKAKGIPTFAIGDLGNETGMATLKEHLMTYIPYTTGCQCGCMGGIAAETAAQTIVTATVSNWGADAVIAAMAFIRGNLNIMHTAEMEKEMIITASRAGMIDMYGDLIPAVDGMELNINVSIAYLMRSCVQNSLMLQQKCKHWFDKVIEKGFFDEERKN